MSADADEPPPAGALLLLPCDDRLEEGGAEAEAEGGGEGDCEVASWQEEVEAADVEVEAELLLLCRFLVLSSFLSSLSATSFPGSNVRALWHVLQHSLDSPSAD